MSKRDRIGQKDHKGACERTWSVELDESMLDTTDMLVKFRFGRHLTHRGGGGLEQQHDEAADADTSSFHAARL